MDPNNAIEIRNITKTFKIDVEDKTKKSSFINRNPTVKKEVKVIDDISLDIHKGDVLGVVGRNGAGKSTFLSLISRIMEPDSGTIERSGKIATILELGMGFHPDMSGRENIYLKGELYGFSREQIGEKIDDIIEYSGIGDFIDNPVRTYSSGMSGRLAFSIMVNVDSDIMLVDEILSVGDVAFSAKALEHFKRMASSGKTVIFVSHNVNFIESMCNRVIWIEGGRICSDGPAKIVCAEYQNKMNESPEIIMDLAEAGVAESQYRLARMYKDGVDLDQDFEAYRMWLQKASMQGHVRAQVEYGDILMGEGNQSEAMTYYLSASKKGDAEARMRVSSANMPRSKNLESLLTVYERYASAGDDPLMEFRYAELLLKLALTDGERTKALEYHMRSAEHGYPNAMFKIGMMYRDGIGTKRDVRKMEEYLVKAADSGFVPSMKSLYDIYLSGRLLPKDDRKAFTWIRKAAESGDVDAMYKLAMMYRDGTGTDCDVNEFNRWLDKHLNAGLMWYYIWALDMNSNENMVDSNHDYLEPLIDSSNPFAINRCMSMSISNGESVDGFVEMLSVLASDNNIDALKRLGNIYYDGIGVERDYGKALSLYERSANLGDLWSKLRVGDMYRDGKGVDVNLNKAIGMYQDASKYGSVVAVWNLIDICVTGMVVDQQLLDESIEKMKSFALSGNADASLRMGNLYYDGRGVRRNYRDAYIWYEKSAELGNAWAKNRIFEMNRDGRI